MLNTYPALFSTLGILVGLEHRATIASNLIGLAPNEKRKKPIYLQHSVTLWSFQFRYSIKLQSVYLEVHMLVRNSWYILQLSDKQKFGLEPVLP